MRTSEINDLLQRILREVVPAVLSVERSSKNLASGLGARQSDDVDPDGLRVVRIEDWSPGNEVDDIASAETGWSQLLTTQYRGEKKLDVRVLLDASAAMDFTTWQMTKRELAARLAAGILTAAACKRDNAGCTVYSDHAIERELPLSPAREELVAEALWLYLSVAESKSGRASRNSGLCQCLQDLPGNRQNLVFVICDFGVLSDREIEALGLAAQTHQVCCLVLTDRRERELPENGSGLLVVEDMRTGQQHTTWLSEARRAGWRHEYRQAKESLSRRLHSAGCDIWWFATDENPSAELAALLSGEKLQEDLL